MEEHEHHAARDGRGGRRPVRRGRGAGTEHSTTRRRTVLALVAGFVASWGCDDPPPAGPSGTELEAQGLCDLDPAFLHASLPPNRIPALVEPAMVAPDSPEAAYLREGDRVLGVVVDGVARAYPHNILWHHEIINDRIGDRRVTVTFCPLTGSGLAFDPVSVDGTAIDFGVSGLLFANNLVMYDRGTGELFGPQLSSAGRCEGFRGARLDAVPVLETSWQRWRELHPDTEVVSRETGHARNYTLYPYQSYDALHNEDLLFPMPVDRRRPLKERVLAVRSGDRSGRGWPFGELAAMGARAAVNEEVGDDPVTVLFEASRGGTAVAYSPRVDGRTLTFQVDGEAFSDRETGSRWTVEGVAMEGPLTGARLSPHPDAYVLFWFAWRHFHPNGTTFGSDG